MSGGDLKARINAAVKAALVGKQGERLITLRMLLAGIKQREVDERIVLDDAQILAVIDKMLKQRRETIPQFEQAGRKDLADKEQREIDVLCEFLPKALTDPELEDLVRTTIGELGAKSIKDMARVMNALRPKVQGRADLGAVSAKVKARLGAS